MKKVISNKINIRAIASSNVKRGDIVIRLDQNGKAEFKLHECEGRWAFISLHNCTGGSSGWHNSMIEAIEDTMQYGEVIVLDNLVELKDYL